MAPTAISAVLICRSSRRGAGRAAAPAVVASRGIVLDVLVQRRRDKQAAKRLLRKLLKKQMRPPRVMITDKLASYGAAKREIMPGIEHRQHKGLNNRAENSHQPARRRRRARLRSRGNPHWERGSRSELA